jgi:hypothetical protein
VRRQEEDVKEEVAGGCHVDRGYAPDQRKDEESGEVQVGPWLTRLGEGGRKAREGEGRGHVEQDEGGGLFHARRSKVQQWSG